MASPHTKTYQFTFVAPPSHRGWTGVFLVGAGAALAAAYAAYRRRKSRASSPRRAILGEVGTEGLEARAAVDRLLQAAFGPPDDVLPYATGPKVGWENRLPGAPLTAALFARTRRHRQCPARRHCRTRWRLRSK